MSFSFGVYPITVMGKSSIERKNSSIDHRDLKHPHLKPIKN